MSVLPFNEKQMHQLSTSIAKAVNPAETRVKEKHVRIAIIGTYQEKGATIFWTYILRQQLQEHRIVAWKFCHVLHKILREGHPRVIPDSQRHRGKLEDIGKLWQHLRDEYGRLIHLYIRLLITKLDFHRRNPRMPGNLQVTPEELEAIGENDINVYFQMTVEMFDYMDDILNLQQAVFGSLDLSRSNSMTPCGQCRLAPLIPCVQDASKLYDYCVKMLFKLHSALPADTLSGHRERFLKQFRDLKSFYNTVMHMHYFKHLITIPSLPEKPPNFLIQSELGTYVTPVVVLPPEEPIDTEGALIDTSDTSSLSGDPADSTHNGSISPDVLAERDSLIEHFHQENSRQRQELQRLMVEHQNVIGDLRNRILELESLISAKGNEILQEKQSSQDLAKQKEEILVMCTAAEGKSKVLEEKFQKLKDVYAKLREEHINLIRKKAEVDKQLGSMKLKLDQSERRTQEAEQRLQEQVQGQATVEQEAQRVIQARADLDEVRKEYDAAKTENLSLLAKIDFISSEKAAVEGELHDSTAQKEELELKISNLQAEAERSLAQTKADSDAALYDLLLMCLSEAESILQNAMHVVDNPAVSAVTCTPEYLSSLVKPTDDALGNLSTAYSTYMTDTAQRGQLIRNAIHTAYTLSIYLMQAKFTSNTSKDISFGDRLTDECKQLGSQGLIMISYMKEKSESTIEQIEVVKKQLEKISGLADSLSKVLGNAEVIGDLVENELSSMDKAIEEAAARIQEMLDKSRAADSGVKLEVNGKILDSCTELMMAIRNLVKKSRFLQMEIVAQGKGTASATEFYKRNHQWSEGLISAAKAIAMGANFLLEAADKVVSGNGKFEQLVVASQGIAASTAQLVVASRVKADRNSTNLSALSEASRLVTQATGGVVATAKSCSQLIEDNEDMDITGLSLHQAKRLEMEAQVRVLELEQALETERLKLSALRRYHYQMAGENDS
ncbi:huntingtin-interacting protein 1 isoform X2 [Phymastichus coffea]|uniref:huntingtin-interacting protein 1 isoform X2 n=2 Tax=Phymastichus coffea TaxID=108790 RepID=UPI00273BF559|nr:huntingtin-interacting protein 1 isoform X2 [Phymastichus coffea]